MKPIPFPEFPPVEPPKNALTLRPGTYQSAMRLVDISTAEVIEPHRIFTIETETAFLANKLDQIIQLP